MKPIIRLIICFLLTSPAFGQILSGDYGVGLKLAFDSKTKKITGFYENSTGWDERANGPQFTCIFYIEGTATAKTFNINTYFPKDKSDDLITGTMEIVNDKTVKIKLPEDHGGCWNVQYFADEAVEFKLEKKRQPGFKLGTSI